MSTVPPWALPPRPGGYAPRRSNAGAVVAALLVAAFVVSAGLIGLVAMSGKRTPVADTGYDYPYTSERPRAGAADDTRTTTTRATAARRTTTTTRATTTARTTTTRTTPAGPRPVLALGDNPLFAGEFGAGPVTCTLSRWATNPQAAAEFFASAIPCLEAAWAPILQRAGLPYSRPNLEVPAGTATSSPCTGNSGRSFAAFYCPSNKTIYMPFGTLQTDLYGARPGVYLALFAHEFGHHVQAQSGVLEAFYRAQYEAGPDTEAGLELSRRTELQAQCFSGMFLAAAWPRGSVNNTILTEARTTQDRGDHTPGEPRDHGTDAHAIAWWEQGAQKNRTFECNTWLVASAQVA
ncbi:MAG TPA: neutral zinc metallopeptidase [Actinophytocola sp.]|uniref:neutral zinc metallopeptidase n=1 Tax=Actinophytocola sp. TaxID=1872138 RepID=UPI002DB96F5A|nr:neutral zinc metallopeptidase [Actinophytocola sp.]HEU5471134.1 neutral zinc metallopeptidase [Actinophytocola sp.]